MLRHAESVLIEANDTHAGPASMWAEYGMGPTGWPMNSFHRDDRWDRSNGRGMSGCPMPRDVQPAGDPDAAVPGDVVEEAFQPGGAGGMASPTMSPSAAGAAPSSGVVAGRASLAGMSLAGASKPCGR